MDNIIPKVLLKVERDTLQCQWDCPCCGAENEVYLFNEKIRAARQEASTIPRVQCDGCLRVFETM